VLAKVVWVDQMPAEARLEGARIDMPAEGMVSEARGLEIWGWVLGRRIQPRYVAFLTDHRVPVRAMLDRPRADIASRFPSVAATFTSGFRGAADVDGPGTRARLVVAAVWPDTAQTPLGAIHIERFWPRDPDPTIASLVSIAVLGADERLVECSLERARMQSYARCELVVVAPATRALERAANRFDARLVPLEGHGVAGAYATAIRRTNGDLLVFLQPGRRLRPDALGQAVAKLTTTPTVAAVLDLAAEPSADRTPALYRRSAIRAAGPLVDSNGVPEMGLLARLQELSGVEGLTGPSIALRPR
jgi:hypothetical protein